MNHKKTHEHKAASTKTTSKTDAQKSKKQTPFLFSKLGRWLPYMLTFIFLWIFCTFTYGDVFTRAVQESYVSTDAELMKHLTDQENGHLYLIGRYLLLMFHNKWIGGLLFSLILTAGVRLMDYALRFPKSLHGVSAIIPFLLLFFLVNKGINLYYRHEPSIFVLEGVGFLVVAGLLALFTKLFVSKLFPNKTIFTPTGWKRWPIGSLIVLLTFIPLNIYTQQTAENTILTARMQNRVLENDMSGLIEDGLSAHQPSRAVAAYYAVGLVQNDLLLEHLFDISFHFPDIHLNVKDNSGEYGIFNADCNFFSGLLNASYRSAMDQIVMGGHRLYYFKRMAICAILNQEKELARKYLDIISKAPFESDFVETYRPMVDNPDLVAQHPIFSKVLQLYPTEKRFEQNYRNPAFLGYNVGMMQGSNSALAPSMAACLYSKDLPNLALRAYQYKQMKGSLPLAVMEALTIHARKNNELYQYFPELNNQNGSFINPATGNVNNFYLSIQQHFNEKYHNAPNWREQMSKELKYGMSEDLRELISKEWLGHYVYYYYCENIAPKKEVKKEESSVN